MLFRSPPVFKPKPRPQQAQRGGFTNRIAAAENFIKQQQHTGGSTGPAGAYKPRILQNDLQETQQRVNQVQLKLEQEKLSIQTKRENLAKARAQLMMSRRVLHKTPNQQRRVETGVGGVKGGEKELVVVRENKREVKKVSQELKHSMDAQVKLMMSTQLLEVKLKEISTQQPPQQPQPQHAPQLDPKYRGKTTGFLSRGRAIHDKSQHGTLTTSATTTTSSKERIDLEPADEKSPAEEKKEKRLSRRPSGPESRRPTNVAGASGSGIGDRCLIS